MNVRMSKLLMVILMSCLAFGLIGTGCKRGPKPGPATTPTSDTSMTSPEDEAAAAARAQQLREEELRRKYEQEKKNVLQSINFDFDKWELSMKARAVLSSIGDWMLQNPKVKLLVEGHCDERGSNEYNLALGQKRANAAKEYLSDYGVAANRLSTVSYGEEKPLDFGHDESAWAKNRRDQFVVTEE